MRNLRIMFLRLVIKSDCWNIRSVSAPGTKESGNLKYWLGIEKFKML